MARTAKTPESNFRTPPGDGSTGLVAAAVAGDRLATLRVLRDDLARQLASCDSKRDYAALSLRFVDVLEQIELCEKAAPVTEGTALDEVAARRRARVASGSSRAARG